MHTYMYVFFEYSCTVYGFNALQRQRLENEKEGTGRNVKQFKTTKCIFSYSRACLTKRLKCDLQAFYRTDLESKSISYPAKMHAHSGSTNGPPAKRHLMAFRWCAYSGNSSTPLSALNFLIGLQPDYHGNFQQFKNMQTNKTPKLSVQNVMKCGFKKMSKVEKLNVCEANA